ncbi:uncharacterized protein [Malus domestica]|uniref:uncharacterized protein n=1 Tax=Malus domestica TaxID=3750 RepID=UPI00397700FF
MELVHDLFLTASLALILSFLVAKLVAMAVAGRESETEFGEGGDAGGEGVGAEEEEEEESQNANEDHFDTLGDSHSIFSIHVPNDQDVAHHSAYLNIESEERNADITNMDATEIDRVIKDLVNFHIEEAVQNEAPSTSIEESVPQVQEKFKNSVIENIVKENDALEKENKDLKKQNKKLEKREERHGKREK